MGPRRWSRTSSFVAATSSSRTSVLSERGSIVGPAVQMKGEGWRIQLESRPRAGDPVCESLTEALEWARETVGREGKPLGGSPRPGAASEHRSHPEPVVN